MKTKKCEFVAFYQEYGAAEDFLRLLNSSLGLIGNSSAGIREASFLGVPTVNIGSRQNMRERGPNVKDVGYNRDEIYNAVVTHCGAKKEKSGLYGNGNAGELIADHLSTALLTHVKVAQNVECLEIFFILIYKSL